MEPRGEMLKIAQANLEKDGELAPVALVEFKDDRVIVGLAGWGGTADERRATIAALGLHMAEMEPWRITVASDTYWKASSDPTIDGSLADDVEAQEAIMVASLDRDGRCETLIQPYVRHQSLDALTIEWGESKEMPAQAFLLEPFFESKGDSR